MIVYNYIYFPALVGIFLSKWLYWFIESQRLGNNNRRKTRKFINAKFGKIFRRVQSCASVRERRWYYFSSMFKASFEVKDQKIKANCIMHCYMRYMLKLTLNLSKRMQLHRCRHPKFSWYRKGFPQTNHRLCFTAHLNKQKY